MIQDEFTQNKSTNDKQLLKAEFGKTQQNEFSDGGEMHLHKSNYNPDLNQTVKNVQQETFAEASSMSSSAAGASGAGASSVSGGATASTIAAGSASVVVAASSVTVVAISVVTGVSVAMHDYQCDVKALFVSSNQITYELTIEDLRQENEDYKYDLESYEEQPCSIRVYNKYYDKTNKLSLGYNNDSFTNLSLGQTYNIVVTADSVSGDKVLYEDVITTASVSKFISFDIDPNYRYYDDSLTVYLDYVDELDYLSDFYLSLTRNYEMESADDGGEDFEPESFTAVYALEKKTGSQDIHISEQDMWIEPDVPYQYEFTYVRNNEKIVFSSGEVFFNSDYEGFSEVYSVYIMGEADFENMTFDVYLDYIDERNIFSDFVLHLSNPDFETIDIPLESHTDKQTISAEQYGVSLKLEYSAYLTYKKDGEEETFNIPDPVIFTDPNQPYSEFYGLIFDEKMDYDTGEFNVTLNYHDDLNYFDNFKVRFVNTETEFDETIELDKTLDEQLILGFEYGFEQDQEYTYIVYYTENGVEKSTDPITFTFSDVYGRSSKFNQFVFTKEGNFLTNVFNVRLDYTDAFGYFSDFVLTFRRSTDDFTATINLDAVTTVQTIDGTEYDMMLRNKTYLYELTCLRKEEEIVLESGTATFTDNSGALSQFNEFVFDGTANKLTGEIAFKLDYVDDFGLYSDFIVTFENDSFGDAEIELENTVDEQTFPMEEYGLFFDTTYSYKLTCLYDGETQELATGTCTITDNSGAVSEFSGVTVSTTANYVNRSFTITLNYQDDFEYFSDFVLTLRDTETNETSTINLQKTTDPQTISTNEQQYNEDSGNYEYTIDIIDHTVVYSLYYLDTSQNITVTAVDNDQLPNFTNSLSTSFNGIISDWKLVEDTTNTGHYFLPLKLDYIDEKRIYGSMELNMYIGYDLVGRVEYQNEVVKEKGEWINGDISTDLSIDDLTGYEIKFVVEGQLMSEKNYNVVEDERVEFYQESHYLTVSDEDKVFAVTTDGMIFGSEAYFTAFFAGDPNHFSNTEIIIETVSNVYTYNVTLAHSGDMIYVMISDPIEGSIDGETFSSEFSEPVTIKFSYCTVTTTSSDAGPETEVFSDPIVIVCYTNFLFEFSV